MAQSQISHSHNTRSSALHQAPAETFTDYYRCVAPLRRETQAPQSTAQNASAVEIDVTTPVTCARGQSSKNRSRSPHEKRDWRNAYRYLRRKAFKLKMQRNAAMEKLDVLADIGRKITTLAEADLIWNPTLGEEHPAIERLSAFADLGRETTAFAEADLICDPTVFNRRELVEEERQSGELD